MQVPAFSFPSEKRMSIACIHPEMSNDTAGRQSRRPLRRNNVTLVRM